MSTVSYRSMFFDEKKSIFTIMYNIIHLCLNYFNTVTVYIYNIHNYSDRRINQSITKKNLQVSIDTIKSIWTFDTLLLHSSPSSIFFFRKLVFYLHCFPCSVYFVKLFDFLCYVSLDR